MPLSEEELRLLEQMEQALAQEDPKFVSTLRGSSLERVAKHAHRSPPRSSSSSASPCSWAAPISQQIWLGVLGFLVMLGSATLGLAAWRGRHAPASRSPAQREEQLFDFDDHPHRFDVIDGGRTNGPASCAARRPQAAALGRVPPARPPSRARSCSAWSSAGSAAATRASDPAGSTGRPHSSAATPRSSDTGHSRPRQPRSRSTLPSIAWRQDSTVCTVRRAPRARRCPRCRRPAAA